MTRTTKLFAAAALGIVLGASACHNDILFRPQNFVPIDPLFERYVSFGNSITAGFQSAGINDSTQIQAYPVLLANRMGSPFFVPYMSWPGCPPPYSNLYLRRRVGTDSTQSATSCGDTLIHAPRKRTAVPPPYISNVAVPGATSLSPTDNMSPFSNSNALTTLFLGGLTQVQAAARAKPTFVTVWIGNNDVLGSILDTANAGNPLFVTDTAVFHQRYVALLDSIDEIGSVRGGVLIGVANVTLVPYLTRGSKFYRVATRTDSIAAAPTDTANRHFPANFVVAPNCAPPHGDSVFVPFTRGAAVLAFARATGAPVGVDCDDVHNVSPAEFAFLVATVARYNSIISAEATARGYAYLDPNALFSALPAGAIPTFPNVPPVSATFTTPVTAPFGTIFSLDGIHPTGAAHKLVANALIPAINVKYGTHIVPIP